MQSAQRVAIAGSERSLDPRHRRVRDADPGEPVALTVYLRPRAPADWVDRQALAAPARRRRRDRRQWADEHGALAADAEAVGAFARRAGLRVGAVDLARRTVELHGPLRAAAQAFGARIEGVYEAAPGARRYRARSGALTIPAALDGIVVGVFGLDDRPQARPLLRRPAAGAATAVYTPPQVAAAYAFPSAGTGTRETVGIVELGGGFSQADLAAYFQALGMPAPTVAAVSVDAGANAPGMDPDADAEVMLDIEVVGAVAPGARITVYFAPNTDRGFLDAVSTAVHDATANPSVVSISWGQSEDSYSAQARAQMEQILIEAAGMGVTVTVAAGDSGSSDGVDDGKSHVDFPASAPHALACGGTSMRLRAGAIESETVWNDPGDGATGGGVSNAFALPAYQAAAHVPRNVDTGAAGRGVPDVCADADPQTGYLIRVDGADQTIGGTSAVAPLWAGLIARLNQLLGAPVGFAQPRMYPLLGTDAFHDITQGNNGAYSAGPGWDACSGLGSPNAGALAVALGADAGA
ncbi:MAG TPA: S53 family peptidase [Solirubrobacteraceae bacterium]|nr:S53 family peptidase [Solirubrobacteraceae bacterium]